MSAFTQLEGTWEEILTHSPELSGQWVRLTAAKVGQNGQSPAVDDALLNEYHDLVDIKLAGIMTDAQSDRLKDIESIMNEQQQSAPNVQALYRQIDEGNAKLDQIIALLNRRQGRQ